MTTDISARFAILLDGSVEDPDAAARDIEGCRIIAADGGIRHAEALGVTPELWVGDFDSSEAAHAGHHAGIQQKRWPRDKAVSDGELAIDEALSLGAKSIILVGALGGPRTDHTLFNLALLVDRAEKGIEISATTGRQRAWPMTGPATIRLDLKKPQYLSVFGFTTLEGLTITGAKWPLDAVHVDFSDTWTLSNEVGDGAEVHLASGRAVVVATEK